MNMSVFFGCFAVYGIYLSIFYAFVLNKYTNKVNLGISLFYDKKVLNHCNIAI